MDASTPWWILCAATVLLELLIGTFYLLMLACGYAAGAFAAQAGLDLPLQMLVVACTAGSSVGLLWLWRRKNMASDRTDTRRDLHLDIGETVEVLAWDAQHHTEVQYRGAQWAACLQAAPKHSDPPAPGPHRIVAVDGNRLVLAPV